jgi:predicted HicB family RNase H-like nuclease
MTQGRQKGHMITPTISELQKICKIMINYKGYIGYFAFDETTNMFYGKVTNTHELITFQGKSVREIQETFQDAVNEHLKWCKKYGKKPEKPFSLEY